MAIMYPRVWVKETRDAACSATVCGTAQLPQSRGRVPVGRHGILRCGDATIAQTQALRFECGLAAGSLPNATEEAVRTPGR